MRKSAARGESDYYEHILDKVPFGSKRWWSIYDEQNGTPDARLEGPVRLAASHVRPSGR